MHSWLKKTKEDFILDGCLPTDNACGYPLLPFLMAETPIIKEGMNGLAAGAIRGQTKKKHKKLT